MLARLIFGTMLIVSSVLISPAQTSNTKAPVCDEEFARFLVDQQVSESRNMEQTDNRLRILIRAAEFLWKFDEPAARDYFTEAFNTANARFKEKGFEMQERGGIGISLPDYRFDVIKAIAAKDSEWAKKLVEQVLKEYEADSNRNSREFNRNREVWDTLHVAEASVKTSPNFSRSLFRRVMQHPLDYYWFATLNTVAQEDRQFADGLYVELLTNYANATPRRLLFLSAYPFASGQIFGIDRYGFGATVPDGFTANRNLQRQFIDVFLRRAISFAIDPENLNLKGEENRQPEPVYMISALTELEPIIVRQFPTFLPQLSEAKGLATGMLSDQMRKDMKEKEQQNESYGSGFEGRLKLVEEADAEGKLTDHLILRLLLTGNVNRTEDEFKKIEPWLSKIKEETTREQTVNYFWFLRSKLSVKEKRLDDAERFAKKIPELEHRALIILDIAEEQLKNVNDAATVYQTLRDVERVANQAETSVEKARVLIALTNKYIRINPIFAMQELSDSIKVVNQLGNADILSTTVIRRINGKDFSFFSVYSLPGQNLEGTFKEISKNNFELSLSNAKSLDDKYLRTLAVLAVAQNCTGQPKKKPATKQPAVKRSI